MSITYTQAVEQTITAGEQIHQIVNGTATTEITVEDGSKIPSVRKALLDNFYFKDPIAWQAGQTENVFNQLRQFIDGSWWYAPSATASTPVNMGATPVGDSLWRVYDFDAIGKLEPRVDEALRRSYAKTGYNLVAGSFERGGELVEVNDVLLYDESGHAYSWKGSLPKIVSAGSSPSTNGGGEGTWQDVSNLVGFVQIGSIGDGVADDTQAFIKAIASGRPVYVPSGIYRITSRITLPENTIIFGDGESSIITNDGSFDVFYFAGARTSHAKGLGIKGIKFAPSVNSGKHLLTGAWFDNVIVKDCFTERAGLINTGLPDGAPDHDIYDSITGYDDLSKNIIVAGNTVIGHDTGTAPVGIYMRYISNAIIANNITNHCGTAGILVWGLDADVARGKGYPGEPRWTGPVTITGNSGYKNIGAHIFCMGARNVSVSGNSGMYSLDVGLDMEGCEDSIVSGNTMNNCVNGNYSQFLYQRNVTFIGNVGESTNEFFTMIGTSHQPIRMFLDSHAPLDSTSRDIRLINNQFRFVPLSGTPSDLMPVWINKNDSWVIEGNTFVNCRVDSLGSNHGASFKRNRFEVTVNPVSDYSLLKVLDNGNLSGKGEDPVVISGNEFRTSLANQGGDYRRALDLDCESFIGYDYIVEDNIAVGFGTSLAFKAGGSGDGKVWFRRNTFSGNILDFTSASWISLNRSFVYWEHNRFRDGLPYFTSLHGKPINVSVKGFIENTIQPSQYTNVVAGSTGVAVSGAYNAVTGYVLGAVVTYGGRCYRSLIPFPNVGNQPDISPAQWLDLCPDTLKASFYRSGLLDSTPL